MSIFNILYTDNGRLLACFIVGLGLSLIFRQVCQGDNCIIIKGPPINQITDNIFKFNSKCYKYSTIAASCDKND